MCLLFPHLSREVWVVVHDVGLQRLATNRPRSREDGGILHSQLETAAKLYINSK